MNYLRIANDVLNIAANKPEYTVETYFNGPRVMVKDKDGYNIFVYEKRGRNREEMEFEYDGRMFYYSMDDKGSDYWIRDLANGKIESSNQLEFFEKVQKFKEQF